MLEGAWPARPARPDRAFLPRGTRTGNGYPNGLAGESIAIEVQIVACWDAFNATATDRPHRAARSPAVALDELRTKHDTHLDPQVFDCLLGRHDSAA